MKSFKRQVRFIARRIDEQDEAQQIAKIAFEEGKPANGRQRLGGFAIRGHQPCCRVIPVMSEEEEDYGEEGKRENMRGACADSLRLCMRSNCFAETCFTQSKHQNTSEYVTSVSVHNKPRCHVLKAEWSCALDRTFAPCSALATLVESC